MLAQFVGWRNKVKGRVYRHVLMGWCVLRQPSPNLPRICVCCACLDVTTQVTYEDLPAIISIEDAIEAGSYYEKYHGDSLVSGDVDAGFAGRFVRCVGARRAQPLTSNFTGGHQMLCRNPTLIDPACACRH